MTILVLCLLFGLCRIHADRVTCAAIEVLDLFKLAEKQHSAQELMAKALLCRYLLAESDTTLYVAFMGTKQRR